MLLKKRISWKKKIDEVILDRFRFMLVHIFLYLKFVAIFNFLLSAFILPNTSDCDRTPESNDDVTCVTQSYRYLTIYERWKLIGSSPKRQRLDSSHWNGFLIDKTYKILTYYKKVDTFNLLETSARYAPVNKFLSFIRFSFSRHFSHVKFGFCQTPQKIRVALHLKKVKIYVKRSL